LIYRKHTMLHLDIIIAYPLPIHWRMELPQHPEHVRFGSDKLGNWYGASYWM